MASPVTGPLDPRRVEADIARVREREGAGFGGGVKANLFNLVIAAPAALALAGGGAAAVEAAVASLLGRRPARIVRLAAGSPARPGAADGAGEDVFGAVVSGRCSPGTLDRGVCLEEIDLAAGGDPLGAGTAAWAPLLARDIPTILWIAGRWSATGLPRGAGTYADKLIVDSSLADDPARALAGLHRVREESRGRLAVADFAWSRALALRLQAARAFDPPGAREALGRVAAVRLSGGSPAEALLFFLWLATRLRWRPAGPPGRDGSARFVDPAGVAVEAVHDGPAPLARGARISVVPRGTPPVEVTCTADGCAVIGLDRGPWRVADDGEVLVAEVDAPRQDAILAAALAMAAAAAGEVEHA